MPKRYTEETQSILDDFITRLKENPEIDSVFLDVLSKMLHDGKLGDAQAIQRAITALKVVSDGLQNQ